MKQANRGRKATSQPARTAPQRQAANAQAIGALLEKIQAGLPDCAAATWSDVGTSGHVRELLVQAAFALGQLTEEEALEQHGVNL